MATPDELQAPVSIHFTADASHNRDQVDAINTALDSAYTQRYGYTFACTVQVRGDVANVLITILPAQHDTEQENFRVGEMSVPLGESLPIGNVVDFCRTAVDDLHMRDVNF